MELLEPRAVIRPGRELQPFHVIDLRYALIREFLPIWTPAMVLGVPFGAALMHDCTIMSQKIPDSVIGWASKKCSACDVGCIGSALPDGHLKGRNGIYHG
jgi:hypothetical protein